MAGGTVNANKLEANWTVMVCPHREGEDAGSTFVFLYPAQWTLEVASERVEKVFDQANALEEDGIVPPLDLWADAKGFKETKALVDKCEDCGEWPKEWEVVDWSDAIETRLREVGFSCPKQEEGPGWD